MTDMDARRRSFDAVARAYETERPGYPDALFDELLATTRVGPGAPVLEIGCGTGKATRSLLARGLRVTAVEPGANLAAIAREALPGAPLEVHVGCIEAWDAPAGAFALAVCAQAYHWVEPERAGPVVARALAPEGRLACIWNVDAERVPWLEAIYDEHAPDLGWSGTFRSVDERVGELRAHIERGGALEVVEVRRYPWTLRKTAEAYVRLLDTYSDHRALPDATRAALYPAIRAAIDAHAAGVLERPVDACVLLARVRGGG